MKNFLVLLSCFFIFEVKAQTMINELDRNKYRKAVDYVCKIKKIKKLNLSDSLVYISYSGLFDQFNKKYNYTNGVSSFDSLVNLDNSRYFKPIAHNFKFLNNACFNEKGSKTLYLSKVYDNLLAVEVLPNKNIKNLPYNKITLFNQSIVYIFEFDKNDNIISVYQAQINYN